MKQIDAWADANRDVPENTKFQDLVETLKDNKVIKGLGKYVGEHILKALNTVETQTVAQVVAILKRKYGRTRMENLEELIMDWLAFKGNDYEDEYEFLLAMEELRARKD